MMSPVNLFSRRKRLRSGIVDPLVYDRVDEATRIRLWNIFNSFLSGKKTSSITDYIDQAVQILRQERGVFQLPGAATYTTNERQELQSYFLLESNNDYILDSIELLCYLVEIAGRQSYCPSEARAAIDSVNDWLAEASIGYQYVVGEKPSSSQLVEVSDTVSHSEIIIPALTLLYNKEFENCDSEFRTALDHIRQREYGDAVSESAKSLETFLKIVAARNNITVDENRDTLKALLEKVCVGVGIDAVWQNYFNSFRSLIEGGLGTARNRLDAHGQGVSARSVSGYVARFAVHQAASAMLFIAGHCGYQ